MDESIDLWHALMIDSSQNNNEENHHKGWKSPTQKEKQQIPSLCVFIVHHQYIPEIHRLRKETEHKRVSSGLMSQDTNSPGLDIKCYGPTKARIT